MTPAFTQPTMKTTGEPTDTPMATGERCSVTSRSDETPTVLTFADQGWLDEVLEPGQSSPPPQVSVDQGKDAEQSA